VAIRRPATTARAHGAGRVLITWKACKDLSGADDLEATKEAIRHPVPRPAAEGSS
jgi:hypothetical protein